MMTEVVKMKQERIFLCADIENLFGDTRRQGFALERTIEATVEVLRRIARRGVLLGGIAIGDADIVKKTAFGLARVRIRPQIRRLAGANAADLELIEYIEGQMPESTTTLVLASGDGIFSSLVDRERARGLHVEIVAVPGTLSFELYRSAERFTPIEIEP